MAQKKGLIYRLTMGKDNLPDFTPNKLPGSRWAVFKDVFTNRLGAMAKVSLLSADIGIAQFAMHSACESFACADYASMRSGLRAFFASSIQANGDEITIS